MDFEFEKFLDFFAGVLLGILLSLTVGYIKYRYDKYCKTYELSEKRLDAVDPPTLRQIKNYSTMQQKFHVAKEPQISSSPQAELMKLPLELCSPAQNSYGSQHQKTHHGRDSPLCRTPSVSSQGSLDSSGSKQGHRGSSPQIRTFAPDGRTPIHHETIHSSTHSLRNSSRSPSPLRAASLDIRCSSPSMGRKAEEKLLQSPKSGLGGSVSLARSLSPLLIPSMRSYTPEIAAPPASPLGAIQPDLYLRKDGPLFIGTSPKSGPSLGRLHFRLNYDFDRSDLVVHLIEAHDLAHGEQGGFNDPYVKLTLLPEIDARRRQTTIRRNDPNPFFDQHFKFPISYEDLQSKSLILQVFDNDRFSGSDVIGEVRMNIDEFNVTSTIEVWGEITKIKKPPEELQEILLSLNYLPAAEKLTIVVQKARNLFLPQEKDTIDPFVKVCLLINDKRVKKKRTAVRKASRCPIWNEALTFNLPVSEMANSALEICVMHQATDSKGLTILGSCVIGPKQSGPEREHWQEMTQALRTSVTSWHTMR